jgi:chromate transporter
MTYRQKCVRLFFLTLYMSSVSLGGGVIILGMLRKFYVEKYGWMTDEEMTDGIVIAQTAPGAIAGNAVMLVGYHVAGVPGALITMFASLIPPLVIITLVSFFYNALSENPIAQNMLRAMLAGTAAVVANIVTDMVISVTAKGKNRMAIIIMAAAFIASYCIKLHALYIIFAAAALGMLYEFIRFVIAKRKKKDSAG